jgi:cadmium resistance protein CadD (predicted permease)
MLNLTLLWTDIAQHLYLAAICLVVAALVAFARTKVTAIDAKLPAALIPYVPIVLGVAAVFFGDLGSNKTLQQAVADAVKIVVSGGLLALPGTLGLAKKPKEGT